jgi:hypothetical protein
MVIVVVDLAKRLNLEETSYKNPKKKNPPKKKQTLGKNPAAK